MASSTELERLIIRLVGDSTTYVKMLEDSANKTNMFSQQVGQTFQKLSLSIAAPLALIGGVSAKTFAQFETQIVRAGALVHGITDKEFRAMESEAKKLGATTVFTAVQAAEAMTVFARSGKRPREIISAMLPTLNLASAELISISQAAEATSDVMAGMQIPADQLSNAIDTLGVASSASRTSVLDLSQGIRYAGPAARQMGVGLEDLTAALEVLAEAGIPGSQAGRGLRTIFARLASPTKEAQAWFDKLGISLFDAQGKFIGMEKTIQIFGKAMDGLTQEEQLQFGTDVAGVFQLSTLQNLVELGRKKFKGFRDQLDDTAGTLQRMADKQIDTLTGSITLMTSAIEGASIEIGQVMAPYLRMAADAISYLTSRFTELSPSVKTLIVGTAALVAGFLAVGGGIALAASFLSGLAPIIVAVVAGIALWGTILTVIEQKTRIVSRAWNVLKRVAMVTWQAVVKIITDVAEGLQPIGEEIDKVFAEGWAAIKEFADEVGPTLTDLWKDISEDFGDIADLWKELLPLRTFLFDFLKQVVKSFGMTFLSSLKFILTFVKGSIQLISEMYTYYRTTFQMIYASVKAVFEGINNLIITAFAVGEFGLKNFGKLWGIVGDIISVTIMKFSNDMKHFFTVGIPALGKFLIDYWKALWAGIGKYSGEILANIVRGVVNVAEEIPKLLAKGATQKEITKIIETIFSSISEKELSVDVPKVDFKPRQITEGEQKIWDKLGKEAGELDKDFDKFLEEKLNRFNKPLKMKVPIDPKLKDNVAPKMEDVGEKIGEAIGQGINDKLDKFKPSEKFESVLFGSVEAIARINDSRSKLFGRDKAFNPSFSPKIPGPSPIRPGTFPISEGGPGFRPLATPLAPPFIPLIPPRPSEENRPVPNGRPNNEVFPKHDVKQEEIISVLKEIRDELKVISKNQVPNVGGGIR